MWCVGLGADNHANASDTPDWRARKLAHKNAGAEAECAEQAAELSRAEAQRYAREFDPRARENDQERAKEQKRLAKEPEEQLLAHTKGQLERQQQLVWNVLVLFYLFISNLSERISATRAHLRRRFPGRRSCLLFDCMIPTLEHQRERMHGTLGCELCPTEAEANNSLDVLSLRCTDNRAM